MSAQSLNEKNILLSTSYPIVPFYCHHSSLPDLNLGEKSKKQTNHNMSILEIIKITLKYFDVEVTFVYLFTN